MNKLTWKAVPSILYDIQMYQVAFQVGKDVAGVKERVLRWNVD